jgi:hypothetical protein
MDRISEAHDEGPCVRISFELPAGSPLGSESLWAARIAEGKYRLENSLFYVYGYSYQDVILAAEKDGNLVVQGPCLRRGHSTYRIFLADGVRVDGPKFKTYWKRLERLGCTYEGAGDRLFSIDVPPSVEIVAVYRILEEGEQAGVWEFEEGHCGHSIAKHQKSVSD